MDPRFSPHNLHLEGLDNFRQFDPQLRNLSKQKYVFSSRLIDEFPTQGEGILTLGGGRQIGKTTLLKQWMLKLLQSSIKPESIAFFTGELIDDYQTLVHIINTHLSQSKSSQTNYIIIDEVNYIRDWDKGIKFLADAGRLSNTILILTGSDLIFIKEARLRFPGRRGDFGQADFHLHPLSFKEYALLKDNNLNPHTDNGFQQLNQYFTEYLIHGGFLTAINDYARNNRIQESTLITYSDWIRGHIVKRGRAEHYLREIIGAVIKRYGSQISWNTLAKDLSVDHPKTVADYIAALESIDAVTVQHALLEDKLVAAPKKPKKIFFNDPFIFHALNAWIKPTKKPFEEQMQQTLADKEITSQLVEGIVAAHYHRKFPTFYIKATHEIDIAYVHNNHFWPIEVKWTNQLRPKELVQIAKYKNGIVLTQHKSQENIVGIPTKPIALALWMLD